MTTYTTKSGFAELDNGSMEVNTSGVVVSYTNGNSEKGNIAGKPRITNFVVSFGTPGEPYHIKSAKFDTVYAGLADSDTPGKSKDSLETWMATATTKKSNTRPPTKSAAKGGSKPAKKGVKSAAKPARAVKK